MEKRYRSAAERRKDIQDNAKRLGIDEAFISRLVETFYARVRKHALLGPVFERAIQDEWDPHLETMKAFWSSVALNSGRYSGRPMPAHMKLAGVTPAHFDIWLALFRQTLEDLSDTEETVNYFMLRAGRIAASLQLGMFSLPGLNKA